MEILRYLFGACIEASRVLGVDESFRKDLAEKLARLAPPQVSPGGWIMEWLRLAPHCLHTRSDLCRWAWLGSKQGPS
jgi:hypothetical protein